MYIKPFSFGTEYNHTYTHTHVFTYTSIHTPRETQCIHIVIYTPRNTLTHTHAFTYTSTHRYLEKKSHTHIRTHRQ